MPLENLPAELQSEICSYLVTSFGPSPIHALLKTSKKMYDVALPFSVQLFRNTSPVHVGGGPCSGTRNVQFLRYILVSKPELAKKVKTVILGGFMAREDGDTHTLGTLASTPGDLGIYGKFIVHSLGPQLSEVDLARRDKWIGQLNAGHSDAQVALILLACVNLKQLYFEDYQEGPSENPIFRRPPCFMFLLEMATRLPVHGVKPPLSHLRHVHIQSHEDNTCGWEQAFRLMALPKLKVYESLNGTNRGLTPGDLAYLPSDLRSSAVEEVTFHQAFAPASDVKRLVGMCQHLKRFEYISATNKPIVGIFARDIMDAMLPHADTLEYLYLNFDDDCRKTGWDEDPHRLYMGIKLVQMTALRSLLIGMQSLTGIWDPAPGTRLNMPLSIKGAPRIVECLPESLAELHLRDCGKGILGQAAELLEVMEKGERLKNLIGVLILFKDENITVEDVELSLNAKRKYLSVCFQPRMYRWLDLGGQSRTFEGIRVIPSLCSRIFADELRHDWLDFRGRLTMKMYYTGCDCEWRRSRVDPKTRGLRLLLRAPPHEYQLDD
ncbi:unnamed protein product [Clonostachys rhizophaga]|uniref:Uncharacterized protein n=1 Tax=Clonostachys rhizophaga TaxID=160324 RepID=A0A9N9V350_9HYPO|nr:unnamed protein product [Clonostachys rhizophaga]